MLSSLIPMHGRTAGVEIKRRFRNFRQDKQDRQDLILINPGNPGFDERYQKIITNFLLKYKCKSKIYVGSGKLHFKSCNQY